MQQVFLGGQATVCASRQPADCP